MNAITAYQSFKSAELWTIEDDQNQWDLSVAISCTKGSCASACTSWNFPWKEEVYGKFYEKWINPTHLLSAAHLSNLYFITGNYKLCVESMEERNSLVSNAFASELFPLIFCPDLASLFDENLQEVLGFLWLFKHLLGGKMILEFSSCPFLFMLYIRIQSSLRLRDIYWERKFNEHRDACKYRFYLYPYHYVLFETAFRNSLVEDDDGALLLFNLMSDVQSLVWRPHIYQDSELQWSILDIAEQTNPLSGSVNKPLHGCFAIELRFGNFEL